MSTTTPRVDSAFDHEQLQQRCMNNKELACRVVESFLTSNAHLLDDIERLTVTRNWQDLARAAHRLKGASDNVGAPRLRQLAAEIEKLASQEPNDFRQPVAALRDEWPRFVEQASKYLGQGD